MAQYAGAGPPRWRSGRPNQKVRSPVDAPARVSRPGRELRYSGGAPRPRPTVGTVFETTASPMVTPPRRRPVWPWTLALLAGAGLLLSAGYQALAPSSGRQAGAVAQECAGQWSLVMRQRALAQGSAHALDEPITFNRITHDGDCAVHVRGHDGAFAQDGSFATIHLEVAATVSSLGLAASRDNAEVTACFADRVNWYGHGEQSPESCDVVAEHRGS